MSLPFLKIFVGPMFSGKTTALINTYKQLSGDKYIHDMRDGSGNKICINTKICVINHGFDDRYEKNHMCNHDGLKIPCETVTNLKQYIETKKYHPDTEIFLINEAQFFDNLFECVVDLVENKNKQVYLCGLDGDFKRQKMGELLQLIPIADEVVKLSATCNMCKTNKAIFTHRMCNNDKQVVIGGSDIYQPLCRMCYLKNNRSIEL